MREALALAARARGQTSPNPMVGAVVVRHGRVVGRGFHRRAGEPHAETFALREAGELARGATMYVSLEPCCHIGRTPPCAPEVAAAGISRLFVAMEDPNPRVSGAGLRLLAERGVELHVGLLEAEARQLNEGFITFITTGLPLVHLKLAMTLDGKIATASGLSRWISGPEARHWVHQRRAEVDAVMVGAGTVLTDDPDLSVRLAQSCGRQPTRVVVAGSRPLPLTAKVFGRGAATLVARPGTSPSFDYPCPALLLPAAKEGVELCELLAELGRRSVTSVLVEGGARLSASLVRGGLVDRLSLFVAPKLFGGLDAPGPFGDLGVSEPDRAWRVNGLRTSQIGEDLLLEGEIGH